MTGFWFDFSGSIFIKAEDYDAACEKFWDFVENYRIGFVEVNHVEEDKDEL